jgi:hypothetical protein
MTITLRGWRKNGTGSGVKMIRKKRSMRRVPITVMRKSGEMKIRM